MHEVFILSPYRYTVYAGNLSIDTSRPVSIVIKDACCSQAQGFIYLDNRYIVGPCII